MLRILQIVFAIVDKLCPLRTAKPEISSNKLPWLWIGAEYTDTKYTVTDIVNQTLKHSTNVTPSLLTDITGYHPLVWKYVDSETLEEKEFPPQGILIE
jgi:hypothetical protein